MLDGCSKSQERWSRKEECIFFMVNGIFFMVNPPPNILNIPKFQILIWRSELGVFFWGGGGG